MPVQSSSLLLVLLCAAWNVVSNIAYSVASKVEARFGAVLYHCKTSPKHISTHVKAMKLDSLHHNSKGAQHISGFRF